MSRLAEGMQSVGSGGGTPVISAGDRSKRVFPLKDVWKKNKLESNIEGGNIILLSHLQAPLLSYHPKITGIKGTEYKGLGWDQETGKVHGSLVLLRLK